MKFLWCDVETTGLETTDSAAFEIAMIYRNGSKTAERDFYLNPLEGDIVYHEDAGKIHGFSEEQIRLFPPAKEVIPKILSFLESCLIDFNPDGEKQKMFFSGYNCSFDWKHLDALIQRYGNKKMEDYFYPKQADVYIQAKKGKNLGRINTENLRLGTVCKSFNVLLENAHNALADIRATRDLAIVLQKKGVPLF